MKKIRKAVIPVAGLGTRFLPVTKSVPKEMLPIVDKPTLQYIIEECVESGIEEVILITSPYKKNIEDHFDKSYELEDRLNKSNKINELKMLQDISNLVKIYYIRQGEPMGSGHAIRLAKSFIGDECFAVLYGDDLMYSSTTPALKQLIDVHNKTYSNVIGIKEVDKALAPRYGMIKYKDEMTGEIDEIIEKPKVEETPSTSAGLGRYIVNSTIFDELDTLEKGAGGEYQFTDAMKNLMKKEKFYACKMDTIYYDTGSKLGYLMANIEYGLRSEELKQDLENYIKHLNIK